MTILRPSELARMKLGVHRNWTPTAASPRAGLAPGRAMPPFSYGRIIPTPRLLGHNDRFGDCVPTGCCQAVQTMLARQGNFTPLSDDLPLALYSEVTGFDQNDPATDQGTDPNQMFAWWQRNAIAGYRLASMTTVDSDDMDREDVISENGFMCAVAALATEQQNQIDWSAAGTPGTWGRHFICLDQYDGDTGFTGWGASKWMDESFFTHGFVQQLYALELVAA